MPKSKALILVIGSNIKRRGGDPRHDPALSITSCLPESEATLLTDRRNRIYRLIKKGGVVRNNKRLEDLPANVGLVSGAEFGGTSTSGHYLPAARRFGGRFFKELGPNGPDLLLAAQHHVLILTGLYGLAVPSEPMQDHNCDIGDAPEFRRVWTEEDFLTKVLLAYVQTFEITRVFDFTAQNSYRFLIAWEKVGAEVGAVFHCFGDQTVGNAFLIPLGSLAREFLSRTTERELLDIRAGQSFDTPYERAYFHPSSEPPAGVPQEVSRQIVKLNAADEIVHMGRCVRGMIQVLTGELHDDEMYRRVEGLTKRGRMPGEIRCRILRILEARNSIEHTIRYSISLAEFENLRKDYEGVKLWAEHVGLKVSSECMEIGSRLENGGEL